MTTLTEPDPKPQDPQDDSQAAPASAKDEGYAVESVQIADEAGGETEGPYQNMWVPLLVIPGAIVIAAVAIVAFLGAGLRKEKSPEENLRTAVDGGSNEREQARFNLIRQLTENLEERAKGNEVPNPIPEDFATQLEVASDELEDDGPLAGLALAIALSQVDRERGAARLIRLLDTPADEDDDGFVRFFAMTNLGWLAMDGVTSAQGTKGQAIAMMGNEDVGLRIAAAAVLPFLEGDTPDTDLRNVLSGGLDDAELQVRATAALSLASLAPPDPIAIPLLTDMTASEIWEEANKTNPVQFHRAEDWRVYQVQAALALAKYGETTRPILERLSEESDDLRVQDAVRRALDS